MKCNPLLRVPASHAAKRTALWPAPNQQYTLFRSNDGRAYAGRLPYRGYFTVSSDRTRVAP